MSLRMGSAPAENPYKPAVDIIFSALENPVRSAVQWYNLYYLVEVEGVQDVRFEFEQLSADLWMAFYWYGVYSITREIAHVDDRYFIMGSSVGQLLDPEVNTEQGEASVREHAFEFLFPDGEPTVTADTMTMAEWTMTLFENAESIRSIPRESTPDGIRRHFELADEHLGLAPNTEAAREYAENVGLFFRESPDNRWDSSTMMADQLTGWPQNFNGPAWFGVTEHLLRRRNLSRTAWVDQSWSIQHNSRNWLNKMQVETAFDFADAVLSDEPPFANSLMILQRVLDAAERDTELLLDMGEYFLPELDINLRRLRQRIGV